MSMIGSIDRKSRGRPRTDTTLVGVRMAPDLIAALDRFIADEAPGMSRPEALRMVFRRWAEQEGLINRQPPDEGKRPSELNSDNDG